MKERNYFIDILKGYAILLVIIGHSLQYGCGLLNNNQFFSNNIFKIIYTFHMPLFILISGYLFFYSEKKRDLITVIKDKFLTLIIPLLAFCVVLFFSLSLMHRLPFNINSLINVIITRYWFFWAIFILSIIVSFINKKINSKFINFIFLLFFIISYFIPDVWLLSLINYSYPFFIIGYLSCKNDIFNRNFIKKYLSFYLVIFNILFIIMLFFFKDNYYIYVSNYYIFNGNGLSFMIFVNVYRFIIGLVGSICSIINIYYLSKLFNRFSFIKDIFIYLGKNSSGIYGISCIIFELIFIPNATIFKFNYFLVLIESVLVIVVCLIIIKLLSLSKVTNKLFLGGK